MKFLKALFFSFLFIADVCAQLNHFIYIESENKQPFYVKINEKVFSASSSGYAIIPKLHDGVYKLNIGFPRNEWPLQNFAISTGNRNTGFLLKNIDPKGWALLNMQTMTSTPSSAGEVVKSDVPEKNTENNSDAFSSLLADAVNAPAIRQNGISKLPQAKVSSDTQQLQKSGEVKDIVADPVIIKPSLKLLSILDQTGRSMIFIDDEIKKDTVRIFIPYDKPNVTEPLVDKPQVKKEVIKESKDLPVESTGSKNKTDSIPEKASQIKDEKAEQKNKAVEKNINVGGNNTYTVTSVDTNCKVHATDEDFLKLRKKMAAANNDENMISAAKKMFKLKCLNTEQIKNLSMLFLNDEGKYNFYDASYHHVSDLENFKNLSNQLSDEYYINRFKAMIR